MLYILVKQDKTAFKVGITKQNDLRRIKDLHRIYNFNLAESFIVSGVNDRITKQFERQLLTDYKNFRYETNTISDGATEFIDISRLPDILQEIEFKCRLKHLGLAVLKGVEFEVIEEKKSSKNFIKQEIQKHSEKYLANRYWRDTQIYCVIEEILENKEKLSYYEITEEEGIIGVLVSKEEIFLRMLFEHKNILEHEKIEPWETPKKILSHFTTFIEQNALTEQDKTLYFLLTLPVKPLSKTLVSNDFEKRCVLINARMKYFQKICKRELKPTIKKEEAR